jgi:hypothetical protein
VQDMVGGDMAKLREEFKIKVRNSDRYLTFGSETRDDTVR